MTAPNLSPYPTAASWAWVRWIRSLPPEIACEAIADATPAQRHAADVDGLIRGCWRKPAFPPCRWWAPPRLLAQPLAPLGSAPCPEAAQRAQVDSWRRAGWCPWHLPENLLLAGFRMTFDAEPQRDDRGRPMLTDRELAAALRWVGALPEQPVEVQP